MQKNTRPLFAILLLATLGYWASLPPVGAWGIVFFVPVLWSILVRQPPDENGRGPLKLRYVYLAAFIFWIASIWWIACPHPLTTLGLIALAAFLSIYWTIFYAAARVAVHRFRVPIIVAFPVCWVGCEFLRNHLLGGFSFCSLEHALYLQPNFIQIADIGGGYLVGAMIMSVGAGFGSLWPVDLSSNEPGAIASDSPRERCRSYQLVPFSAYTQSIVGILILVSTAYYGVTKTLPNISKASSIRIAALQGNIPVTLPITPEFDNKVFDQYLRLAAEAVDLERKQNRTLDLVVWPETVCPIKIFEFRNGGSPEDIDSTEEDVEANHDQFGFLGKQAGVPMLLGTSKFIFEGKPQPKSRLNSALLVDPAVDEIGPRYDKVQLVMFGEYIPFSSWLPDSFFLKTICVEATPGEGPVAIPLGKSRSRSPRSSWAAVNICFESTIPHLIREQVLTLNRQNTPPCMLINISNDGWFWFSQQIDQHLATHVFRAIENRLPCVTATNGGFSAFIDDCGRIQQIGERRKAQPVIGNVLLRRTEPGFRQPIYHTIGDWPPFVCSLLVLGMLLWNRLKIARR